MLSRLGTRWSPKSNEPQMPHVVWLELCSGVAIEFGAVSMAAAPLVNWRAAQTWNAWQAVFCCPSVLSLLLTRLLMFMVETHKLFLVLLLFIEGLRVPSKSWVTNLTSSQRHPFCFSLLCLLAGLSSVNGNRAQINPTR